MEISESAILCKVSVKINRGVCFTYLQKEHRFESKNKGCTSLLCMIIDLQI